MRTPLSIKSPWNALFPNSIVLVAVLFLVFAAFRAYGYFGSELFQGPPIMLGFVLMWFAPFVFLTPESRRTMGFVAPPNFLSILVAILAGGAAAYLCYLIGILLYGNSEQNWFVSVGYTYLSDQRITAFPRDVAFLTFTIPAIIASPIGEEFFFRGMVHHAVEENHSWRSAALANSLLFAAVHLIHHGIHRTTNGIEIYFVSGTLWFLLMALTSLLFSYLRKRYHSIWTCVAAHSAFNLVMNATIFYSLFIQN